MWLAIGLVIGLLLGGAIGFRLSLSIVKEMVAKQVLLKGPNWHRKLSEIPGPAARR
jgi:hypothetical protein